MFNLTDVNQINKKYFLQFLNLIILKLKRINGILSIQNGNVFLISEVSHFSANMDSANQNKWDRPWTTEELIENAENWSLAGDVALLNTIRAFSEVRKIYKKANTLLWIFYFRNF